MDRMICRLPDMNDEAILRDYVQEHYDHGEEHIYASCRLATTPYGEWVGKIRRCAREGEGASGRSLVLLCFDGERLVGLLSVRDELPRELSESIGDIGYGVRPTERRKGYATAMLRHALDICREKGKTSVIVGCYKDNEASAATIRKCGGVFIYESDNYTRGRPSLYFRIDL